MPDVEPNDLDDHWNARERMVVYLLTDPDRYPTVWSIADIGREMSDQDPMAVVVPLCEAGLLHRLAGDFVVATPAAYRMVQLVGRAS
ncbi:MAG: hypothetical protein ACYCU0_03105 [Solirubrobacteraceae bacterium]